MVNHAAVEYLDEDGKEWDDEDIKMLITFGF